MALLFKDRVQETSTTTGTGAYALAGAVSGFQAFSAIAAVNDTAYYSAWEVDTNGNPSGGWETGLGTYSAANTLTRTTIMASSNANAAVNWATGTRRVALVPIGGGPPFSWVDATGNFVAPYAASTTTPPADSLEWASQRLGAGGGRVLPRWKDESGFFTTMQAHLARNDIIWMVPRAGVATIDPNGATFTALGTLTLRSSATTNRATRTKRVSYVSSATAGNLAGLHLTTSSYTTTTGSGTVGDGSGFLFIARFIIADTVATANMFIGMGSQTPSATANPNTLTNVIGIAQLAGGANLNLVYGGSAAQTAIDLGANFPANTNQVDLYEVILFSPSSVNGKVAVRVERISTPAQAPYENVITAGTPGLQLPASSTLIGPKLYRGNNTTAAAVTLDLASIYLESNY